MKTRAQSSVRGVTGRYPPPRCKHPRMGPVVAAVPYPSAPQPDAAALIEIVEQATHASPAEWAVLSRTASRNRPAEGFNYDPERQTYCMITVRRPGATLPDRHGRGLAAMLRNQCRQFSESPGQVQQGLTLS